MNTSELIAWVERHHFCRLNDGTRAVLVALLDAPPDVSVEDALANAAICGSTATGRLRKKRLPPAFAWRRLARSLDMAHRLRADGSVTAAAHAMGCTHSNLCHQMRRSFGRPATRVRRTRRDRALAACWWELHGRGRR